MATDSVILSDTEGNYYVISRDLIENSKVTNNEQKAELDKTVKGGGDVSGFALFQAATPLQLGTTQLRPLGACACDFSFDRQGILEAGPGRTR
jgi:hypothetical protein